jgi:DNA-directed RNA polymerase II subunit RPB1
MSIYPELAYSDQKIDIQDIKGIQFSVLGPEEIIKRSVVEITKTDTYAGSEPIIGGLFDSRMGVLEHNKICSTCEQKNIFCPGHFGHIKLAKPVFHAMFFDITKKILKCVCYKCSKLLISHKSTNEAIKNDIKKILLIKNNQKRWETFFKLTNKIINNAKFRYCGDDGSIGCNARQPTKYTKEGSMKIIAEWKSIKKKTEEIKDGIPVLEAEDIIQEFTAEDVLRIFQRISEEEMELMGFNPEWNRPEWMICSVLPVPPPSVRPSIIEENGQRREDDLTHKLSEIIKINNNINDKIAKGTSEETIKLITMVLQYHVFTFIDNQIPGLAPSQQRNGRKLKSVSDRMKKKEGRIRGNLNGKRVDQSSRSVITPDPYISIDELGVPIKIAINITFPEVVNEYNIEYLKTLILNGPDKWPGAKLIKKNKETITINLKSANLNKLADELKYGDIVHRHLSDGDHILFNRQPSLHKMSMMCHKVIIMPYQTFRLNVLDTPPYNADFDGDEMNLHCPQSIQTMSELKDIAAVPYMIIAPRDGKPIIEIVQDTLLGSFRLTKNNIEIKDKTMANLQMINSYFRGQLKNPDKNYNYTGKEAYTQILPPGLNIERKNKADDKVIINGSNFLEDSGSLDKSVFHSKSSGLIPVIYHDYGPFETQRFLDNTQRLICRWLLTSGFSVGISDLVTDIQTEISLKSKIKEMKEKAYSKLDDIRRGLIENNSIFSNKEYIERELIGILNETTNQVGKIGLSQIDEKTNRMINMVKCGSKGKETNVAQMIACVGQQNVDGKRISYGFTDRTLPHYTKYDDGPEARGFVENSFISGLSPQEVFFHAMGGREGLIDTAVKTSETGYIQRRLVKAMEDAKVYYDNTVRNASGTIIQYIYGEDGMDGCKIENQYIPYIDMDVILMENIYHLKKTDKLSSYLVTKANKEINAETYKKCTEHYNQLLEDKEFLIKKTFKYTKNKMINFPIPFDRIINNAYKNISNIGIKSIKTDLTPKYILDNIDKLINTLYVKKNQGTKFFEILLRLNLTPKKLIMVYNFTKDIFDNIISLIIQYYKEAIAQPGEMVGIVAAQTIGEMGTQMTLDSFHVSGTAAAVKATSGVPRLKEILSATKKTKTPTLLIYMKDDIATVTNPILNDEGLDSDDINVENAKNRAINIKNSIEITKLHDILEYSEIYWDKNDDQYSTNIQNDKGLLDIYNDFSFTNSLNSTSPWIIRMKFNKEKMKSYGLRMIDIYTKLNTTYDKFIECVYSDDNAEECIFRIKLQQNVIKDIDFNDQIAAIKALEHNIVYQILLKGYKGIKKVSLNKKKYTKYNDLTNTFDNLVEWVLDTDGTNLIEVLSNPNIDSTRTISNDIREISETLGIEAARTALYHELINVTSEDSMNYRHLSLLIDTMTYKGQLMSIDRHGINRGDIGPLAKSSFEETTDMLINASIFAEYDNVNGVSANVMLGQQAPCGTGDSSILLDEEHMIELMKDIKHIDSYDDIDITIENNNICTTDDIEFNYKIEKNKNKNKNKCVTFKDTKIIIKD